MWKIIKNITVGFKISKLACKNISMPIFKNSLEWNLLAKSLVCFFDREKIKEHMLFLHKTTTTPKTKHQQKSANNISLSPHLRYLPKQNPSLENTYFQMHSIRRLISERLAVWLFLPWLQYVPVSVFLPLIPLICWNCHTLNQWFCSLDLIFPVTGNGVQQTFCLQINYSHCDVCCFLSASNDFAPPQTMRWLWLAFPHQSEEMSFHLFCQTYLSTVCHY